MKVRAAVLLSFIWVTVVPSLRAQTQPPAGGTNPTSVADAVTERETPACSEKARDEDRRDDRCDFEASFYVGRVIDSFAAAELNNYINPNDAQKIKESYIAGVDAAYRF